MGLHLFPDLLQSQDWVVKLNLKDAYLQVPHPPRLSTPPFIPDREENIQVSMPTFWPINSTQSVYNAAEASSRLSETE